MSNRIEGAANQLRSQTNDFASSDLLVHKRAKFILKAADSVDASEGVVRVSTKDTDLERAAKALHPNLCTCNEYNGKYCDMRGWDAENAIKVILKTLKVES